MQTVISLCSLHIVEEPLAYKIMQFINFRLKEDGMVQHFTFRVEILWLTWELVSHTHALISRSGLFAFTCFYKDCHVNKGEFTIDYIFSDRQINKCYSCPLGIFKNSMPYFLEVRFDQIALPVTKQIWPSVWMMFKWCCIIIRPVGIPYATLSLVLNRERWDISFV